MVIGLKLVFFNISTVFATATNFCWFYPQNRICIYAILFAELIRWMHQAANGAAGWANVGLCPHLVFSQQ